MCIRDRVRPGEDGCGSGPGLGVGLHCTDGYRVPLPVKTAWLGVRKSMFNTWSSRPRQEHRETNYSEQASCNDVQAWWLPFYQTVLHVSGLDPRYNRHSEYSSTHFKVGRCRDRLDGEIPTTVPRDGRPPCQETARHVRATVETKQTSSDSAGPPTTAS